MDYQPNLLERGNNFKKECEKNNLKPLRLQKTGIERGVE